VILCETSRKIFVVVDFTQKFYVRLVHKFVLLQHKKFYIFDQVSKKKLPNWFIKESPHQLISLRWNTFSTLLPLQMSKFRTFVVFYPFSLQEPTQGVCRTQKFQIQDLCSIPFLQFAASKMIVNRNPHNSNAAHPVTYRH
jgi:hypothetical protein